MNVIIILMDKLIQFMEVTIVKIKIKRISKLLNDKNFKVCRTLNDNYLIMVLYKNEQRICFSHRDWTIESMVHEIKGVEK